MTSGSPRARSGGWRPRRALAAAVAAALGLTGLAATVRGASTAAAGPAQDPTTYLESKRSFLDVSPNQQPTYLQPDPSVDASISGDGRFVAFVGPGGEQDAFATNPSTSVDTSTGGTVVDPPPPARRSVWLRDRKLGTLTEVTPFVGTDSMHPTISRDGCYVGFLTTAGLDPTDTGTGVDVYTWRNPAKTTCVPVTGASTYTLVSADAAGKAVDGQGAEPAARVVPSQRPALSADGTKVAYVGAGAILGTLGSSGVLNLGYDQPSVYVVDLTKAPTAARTVTPPDRQDAPPASARVRGSMHPALTDDGATLVYATDANPFAASGDALGGWALQAGGSCSALVAAVACNGSTGSIQVYTWQVGSSPAAFRLVSHRAGVDPTAPSTDGYADRPSLNPEVSADGKRIAFASVATDLLDATTTSTALQVYAYDVPTDQLVLVSAAGGTAGNGHSGMPYPAPNPLSDFGLMHSGVSISGDGRTVAFHTEATNLSSGTPTLQGPADLDVFVAPLTDPTPTARLAAGALEQVNVTPAGEPVDGNAAEPSLSTTGRYVAFDSALGSQLLGYGEAFAPPREVYVRDRLSTLTITPSPLDFGSVGVGASASGTATVTNQGPGSWVFAQAFASGAFTPTGGSCASGLLLAPGASCTIDLAFGPTAAGPVTGSVRAYADASTDFTAALDCAADAVGLPCDYWHAVNPATPLTGVGVATGSTEAPTTSAESTTTTPSTGPTTSGGPTTTKAPATTAKPTATTARPVTTTAAKPTTTALVPRYALRLEPPSADYGVNRVGTPSPPLVFQLRNVGNVPNAVASVATAGINAAEFRVTVNGCAGVVLAVNQACPITVVHTPLDSGGRAATLVAFGQGGSSGSSVLLSSGIYTPAIAFSPAVVTPGRTTALVGTGFPKNTPITLSWVGEDQPPIFTITDAEGGVRLTVFVMPNQNAGTRTMIVGDQPGRFGSVPAATLLVALATYQPQGDNPAFAGQGLLTRG